MIDRERAKLAREETYRLYHNMPEFQDVHVIWYEGDRAVKMILKYKTDYPFTNKVFEVPLVKQIIGQSDSYI